MNDSPKVRLKKIKDRYMPIGSFSKTICGSNFIAEEKLEHIKKTYPQFEFVINTKNSGDEIFHAMLELTYDEKSKHWKAKVQGKDHVYNLMSKKYKDLCKTVMRIQVEEFNKIYSIS